MNVAEKHILNGNKMLDEFNLDMAAFYYETAAEMFLGMGEKEKAIEAYEKVLYCYDVDDKKQLAEEIRKKILSIKND